MTDKEYFNHLWNQSKCRILVLGLLACLAVSITMNVYQYGRPTYDPVGSDTVTVEEYRERTDTTPQAVEEKVIGYVKKSRKSLHDSSVMLRFPENLNMSDSDSMPIVQRKYEVDSLYTAYVSGPQVDSIGPRLDSISVKQLYVTTTITNTVEQRKKFHWGIVGGVGYGVFAKQPDFFIGLGVMYEF